MPQAKFVLAPPPKNVGQTACSRCGKKTRLSQTIPDKPGYDQRTFQCVACGHEEVALTRWRLSFKREWH